VAAEEALVNGTRDALVPSFQTHSLSSLGKCRGANWQVQSSGREKSRARRPADWTWLRRTGSPRTITFDNAQSHAQHAIT
jgi:hypothetical protein